MAGREVMIRRRAEAMSRLHACAQRVEQKFAIAYPKPERDWSLRDPQLAALVQLEGIVDWAERVEERLTMLQAEHEIEAEREHARKTGEPTVAAAAAAAKKGAKR